MYSEDDLVPISALQHILFCERQCALIHIERVWSENRLTVEGQHLHEKVDEGGHETRRDIRYEYHVPLISFNHGLTGYADMIEFHLKRESGTSRWMPYPVEYKRGVAKENDVDRVQLCAQALCLEEMLDVHINEGALFYATPHRRTSVTIDEQLRNLTMTTAQRAHDLFLSKDIPVVQYSEKCRNCSLKEICMPPKSKRSTANAYIQKIFTEVTKDETRS